MIIACPACATRYVVPDSAIGIDGRTVRCAKCRHSWFQDGPELAMSTAAGTARAREALAAAPPPPPVAAPAGAGAGLAVAEQQTILAPRPGGDAVETPPPPAFAPPGDADSAPVPEFAETGRPIAPDPYPDEAPSSFAHEPPFRPRRNPAKLWTAAAVAFAVLVAVLIGAVSWFGMPNWVPITGPTFAEAQPDLVLEFPAERQDRRTLPNGTEFFGASGSVTNVGQETRRVPPILIVLRDGRDRIVYTWEVAAPKPALAPGESVTVNEAVTDVPRSARVAEIGWKPG